MIDAEKKNERRRPFIIAELGSSHGGDSVKAAELIAAAADSGANCVKCQIIFADEIIHAKTGAVLLPGGEIPLYEVFRKLEKPVDFYRMMKNEAEQRGIRFLATPFGHKSAALLKMLEPEAVKIASPELNYGSFLSEIGSWGKPIYLSSGISTLGDIEEALKVIREHIPGTEASPGKVPALPSQPEITLLHCVTSYPAPPEDYNLRLLPHLAGIFGVSVGLSDHSLNPVLVPVLGTAMGASAIEKHFCLSRKDLGLDDPIALDPPDFAKMCAALRGAASSGPLEIIAEISGEFGREIVEKILGSGVKTLSPSETANYGRTNRSIHAVREIKAGEIITQDMFAVLRSEKVLRPGLHPRWEKAVAGRIARRDIPAGEGIRLEDI